MTDQPPPPPGNYPPPPPPPGNYPPPPPPGGGFPPPPPPGGGGYPPPQGFSGPAPAGGLPPEAYTPWLTRVLAYLIDGVPVMLLYFIGVICLVTMQKVETVCID